jgi:hypothetical protein
MTTDIKDVSNNNFNNIIIKFKLELHLLSYASGTTVASLPKKNYRISKAKGWKHEIRIYRPT